MEDCSARLTVSGRGRDTVASDMALKVSLTNGLLLILIDRSDEVERYENSSSETGLTDLDVLVIDEWS